MTLDELFAPFSPPDTHLVDRLRYWVQVQPSDVAFIYLEDGEDDERSITYAMLDRRARAIAVQIATLGLQGQRALLLYPPGLEFVSAYFGCLYAGAVPVPAYPPRKNRNMQRIEAISDNAEARIALTVSDVLQRVEGSLSDSPGLEQLNWLATDQLDTAQADQWQPRQINNDDVAMLQYTSGSTGEPKGVMLTHGNLMHNCGIITQAFEFSRTGCGMTWLPTYHDMGLLGGVLSPLYFGRPNVLISPMAFLLKPVRWLKAITRYGVTISGGPNFAYGLCNEKITTEECDGLDLSSWDIAFNGAEPIRSATLEAFTAKFRPYGFRAETHYPCYGMAETTLIVTGGTKSEAPICKSFDARAIDDNRVVPMSNGEGISRELISCGRALPDEEVVIVEPETRQLTDTSRIGEIWVRSPSVGQGYWNKPDETDETFHAHINGNGDQHWLRTGDLGFLHDGELFVTGRLKDLIIVRGVNRYPQDIESTVEDCSERVRSGGSAAFAVDHDGSERLVIVCEVERNGHDGWDDVIQLIRRSVNTQHELPPDAVILVRAGSVPKTSSGKVQRNDCRQQFMQGGKLREIAQWCVWDLESSSVANND